MKFRSQRIQKTLQNKQAENPKTQAGSDLVTQSCQGEPGYTQTQLVAHPSCGGRCLPGECQRVREILSEPGLGGGGRPWLATIEIDS